VIRARRAGAAPQGGLLELDDDSWSVGFGLKLFANLRIIKRAWPLLKSSRGHLVMIGGGTARTPEKHLSLVSAVNGGIAALSKSVAEQGLEDKHPRKPGSAGNDPNTTSEKADGEAGDSGWGIA
jgi:NAD(P)-dependent dehydrogenase (short-subunit alcohol dehydrogenase family)